MFIHKENQNQSLYDFAEDVERGLSQQNKFIASKYFYDDIGSKLFEQICMQEEYYLTSKEISILNNYSNEISEKYQKHSLIEMGSGNSEKTRILLKAFSNKESIYYFPIDIDHSILYSSIMKISNEFLNVYSKGVAGEFVDGINKIVRYIERHDNIPKGKLILFIGSSIGNFEYSEVLEFLTLIRKFLEPDDGFLIGFDLIKNKSILENAYNDKSGITAKFNLNLLSRINKELDGQFNLNNFQHYAYFNDEKNRIEMHIISKKDQLVKIGKLDKNFHFRKNESIHTENSYKYTIKQIENIALKTGYSISNNYLDKNKWYNLALFTPN